MLTHAVWALDHRNILIACLWAVTSHDGTIAFDHYETVAGGAVLDDI